MLEVADLTISLHGWTARYDLVVRQGDLCALVGPSGGGKTTLLHAIAGFVEPAAGAIRFAGQDLTGPPPPARPLSILFQEHNLFPHLTAAQNVGLGLHPGLKLAPADRDRVSAALARVGLAGMETRRPADLSGGQRQRVALARALVRDRPLMLLDEPFSALDPGLRRDMIALVDEVRRERGLTVLMSIHTPEDALGIAEALAFVADGAVVAAGAPDDLLAAGGDARLAAFFGRGPAGGLSR